MRSSTAAPATRTETELPLRVFEVDGTPAIRCLCGAELAAVRGHNLQMMFSSGGLLRMILHARKCPGRQGLF